MPITPSITFDFDGALFRGEEGAIIQEYIRDATDEIASQALANVHMYLNSSIQNPTPYYETQIIKERAMDTVIVHDRGIIYGPWLEGTGSKNRPRPGFPGYHSFRRARQQTGAEAGRIAQAVLRRYLGRM